MDGSGVRHVTVYVATDDGDYEIWQRQRTDTTGSEWFSGEAGHSYRFLARATDRAGNRETATGGVVTPDDGSQVNLGAPPSVGETTPPNFGIPPAPTPEPSANPLFVVAEQQVPASRAAQHPSEFDQVLQPFVARAFATGFDESLAGIGPMAVTQAPDDVILVSGGVARNEIYRFGPEGGIADSTWVTLEDPVYNLAFDLQGRLWATTGGGALLQLSPETGDVLARYGDGLGVALAVEPNTGTIYVSSGGGVERFDPETGEFAHYSRDLDLRVGSLGFDSDGVLWATTWPDRSQVVQFNNRARAKTMLAFDTPIDSLAFGQPGTELDGLLFVSHNSGELTLVDVDTLRTVTLAEGGSRGDVLFATSDGRVLLSQSGQVDILNPATSPLVVATNPPLDAVAALPMSMISVVFDQPMFVGDAQDSSSVTNPQNYDLVGEVAGEISVLHVGFDNDSLTALLTIDRLPPDRYMLTVGESIGSVEGLSLEQPYETTFTAVSDVSAIIDLQLSDSRWSRIDDTVTYDVVVVNRADRDLVLPVVLTLEPTPGTWGIPTDAVDQWNDGRWFLDLSASLPAGGRLAPAEATVGRPVRLYADGGHRADYEHGVSASLAANQAPRFDSAPVIQATVDQLYQYQVEAHDPDGVALVYLLLDGPEGMRLDPLTGELTWLPSFGSPAKSNVALGIYDALGGQAKQSFVLSLDGGNRPPILGELPREIEGMEGGRVEIYVQAVDPDGDGLTYLADQLPAGATFDAMSQKLVWQPDYNAAGIYPNVTFSASDGRQRVSQQVTLRIHPADQGPYLVRPGDHSVQEGERLRFYLQGEDPDGDPIRYVSNQLPAGASLHPMTGLLDWTPGYDQAGTYVFPVRVASAGKFASTTATIEVLNANGAPVFDLVTDWITQEGQPLRFRAVARDPDQPGLPPYRAQDGSLILAGAADSVTYEVSGLPAGAEFDAETATLTWVPGYQDAGEYELQFTATDDGDGTGVPLAVTTSTRIVVQNANRAPELTPVANVQVPLGESLDIPIAATDADGNPISLRAESRTGRILVAGICHVC